MDFDRSLSEVASQPSLPVGAIARNVHYLEAACLADVMFDQLEYLLAHAGGKCAPGCMDCRRLEEVKNWLLLPFRAAGPHAGVNR
jgi:hypothetical protein